MSDYTPTTDEVRSQFVGDEPDVTYWPNEHYEQMKAAGGWYRQQAALFDRWLAAHEAAIRADEREKGLADMTDWLIANDLGVPPFGTIVQGMFAAARGGEQA